MKYKFLDFEFDSISLILSKNNNDIAIRHNEAKLLALMISQPERVFSKEDILAEVWQDKVVSEQAVFQNISHLRGLFGNTAIKTFSKRGYQWQLELQTKSEISTVEPSKINVTVKALSNSTKLLYITAFSLIFILVIFFGYTSPNKTSLPTTEIAYIPFEKQTDNTFKEFSNNPNFNFIALNDLDYRDFIATSELKYPNLSTKHPLILTGEFRSHNQQAYLDFILKGPFAQWKGLLSGDSQREVTEKLKRHLQQDFIYDLIGKPQAPELKLANLSIAHQNRPKDFIVLNQLIKIYLQTGEFDKAMVMADKLVNIAKLENSPQQVGMALLLQSEILTQKDLFELSSQKLKLALIQFKKINDLKRQADALNAQSWIDHQQDNYTALKTSLLQSAELAFNAKDIPRELHALTYLSVMAHKHKQQEDKYLYLQQAENKMLQYELPIYHFAKIPFHYAIFAKNLADKEPHYKQVLEHTLLTPNHWVAQDSRESLVKFYIAQNRLEEARALIKDLKTDNAYNSYLKTILAQAQLQTELFITQAQRTFEQAQLSGNKYLSLDIALLLCDAPKEQTNYDFYSQFISENATLNWRRRNEEKLVTLNL
ncbi:winged helix-turn-helix domain-containing protein [Pseudoalteromonas sp. C2R02]|uniref:winged helix-turn-helix domain-containing protein n=1 Tax=Pseudoalteromonas sp. C2R02 TaxID=2841565 RepID=UPI001C09E266|nr:winged helix-turn-helix domain-containing protein [Pseudoalteromonas sp. C2R02]MBU2972239.1 winged helix-turn-helix domain-containing protein [Pseudoalteromonas sp. C2R02]